MMNREKLLIVDGTSGLRDQLVQGLGNDYILLFAENEQGALSLYQKHRPRVVTLDLESNGNGTTSDGRFRCLERLLERDARAKIIVIAGQEDRAVALRAVELGAFDCYPKPVAMDELKVSVRRASRLSRLEMESRHAQAHGRGEVAGPFGMVGQCPELIEIYGTIRKAASSDVAVLIQGESGTGKELVAQAIHAMSMRRTGPFVPIHCGAIPDNLIEAELFGHEKGAYTGAHEQVLGRVEYAHGGTLFLDEIGDLPGHLQVKLLRFLQDRKIQRVGGREEISVDLRIVSATNRDLAKDMTQNRFREDLYYRIGVVVINLPPLRERKHDIVRLSGHFLLRYSRQYRKRLRGFTVGAFQRMERYAWPGNVRELENRVQRAVILSEGPLIDAHDLGFAESLRQRQQEGAGPRTLREARDKVEREMVMAAIDRNRGNIARAAEELGVSRPTLYDTMKKHGLFALPASAGGQDEDRGAEAHHRNVIERGLDGSLSRNEAS
jgi:two-component system NtrC family response regulator